jgi:iron-sulfur cluster repair protein YtfE (RIC family)
MCHYCGCRDMPLIRDLIAEHEQALDCADDIVRALDRRELPAATDLLGHMHALLSPHWEGEENGVFAVMAAREEQYADYVRPLIAEHRELAQLLASVDVSSADGEQAVRVAFQELRDHIRREEDGLFPASLTALAGDDWNAAMQAWRDAHPGEDMISG